MMGLLTFKKDVPGRSSPAREERPQKEEKRGRENKPASSSLIGKKKRPSSEGRRGKGGERRVYLPL